MIIDPKDSTRQVLGRILQGLQEVKDELKIVTNDLKDVKDRLAELKHQNPTESKSTIMSVQDHPLNSNFNSSESLSSSSSNHRFYKNYHKENFNDISEKYYNFMKDVQDFMGFDSPALLSSSDMHSFEDDPDLPVSFRHVLEKITNPLDMIPNHHFQTF